MANEEMNNGTTPEVADNTQDYIDTINQMKANSVSRAEYEKLVRENRQLINSLANGATPEAAKPKEIPNVKKMRDELVHGEYSNLEYVKRALELRNAMIEQGHEDPFLPVGKQISATADDIKTANRVVEGLQHCVEYANGDSQLFTAELQRITRDTVPMAGRRR